MTTPLQTPEDVCNYALRRIGYPMSINNLLDGSRASMALLKVYGQTRDALLTEIDWDFAERSIGGTLQKQAPQSYVTTPWTNAYPCLPWRYQYAFPSDGLKIRGVKNQPVSIWDFDPRYNRFSVDNDNTLSPAQKVVLTNVASAIIIYTGQITNPNDWSPSFLDALADRLGQAAAPVLMGLDNTKLAAAERQGDEPIAAETRT